MNNIYKINNEKFKSIYFSINFTMNTDKKEMSENSILACILSKACQKYNSQKEIQKYLYSLYGANFDIGIEKYGDLYNIEFRCECINKQFLPNNTDVVNELLLFLYNIIFLPKIINNSFDDEIVKREKEVVINKIREIKDDKLQYGIRRAEELICENEPFSTYVYGDEDEVSKITSINLYKRYKDMISKSCISFIVSGNLNGYDDIEKRINDIFYDKLNSNMEYKYLEFNKQISSHNYLEKLETQDTTQSVIAYGLRIVNSTQDDFYKLSVYNSLLGGSPSSKLFQNFREKNSLAYTVRSRYYRFKDMIIIYAGIKKENYEKAKEVLENEITSIKQGNITNEEFFASKESVISDLREWKDSKIALSKLLLSNMIANKGANTSIEDMIEKIRKVTKEDIIDISQNISIEKIFFLRGDHNV